MSIFRVEFGGLTWTSLAIIWAAIVASFFVGGLMVEYCLESWIGYAQSRPVDVSYWLCCFGGLFVAWNIAMPATILTAILITVL